MARGGPLPSTDHTTASGHQRAAPRLMPQRSKLRWSLPGLMAGGLASLILLLAPWPVQADAPASGHGAKPADPVKVFKDCADCPEMVAVPAGSFVMGSPPAETGRFVNEGPQRTVKVEAFAAGRFTVTFEQWDACHAAGACKHRPSDEGWGRERRPVIHVNWDDVQQYLAWISDKTGKAYRLLSEAEWEYAARAGSTGPYPWGDQASHEHANYGGARCCAGLAQGRDQWVNTAPVGQFEPNAFGLHDMHGNVWVWVQDIWHNDYTGAPDDARAWMTGGDATRQMLRGGSWRGGPQVMRSAYRNGNNRSLRYNDAGFRLARAL